MGGSPGIRGSINDQSCLVLLALRRIDEILAPSLPVRTPLVIAFFVCRTLGSGSAVAIAGGDGVHRKPSMRNCSFAILTTSVVLVTSAAHGGGEVHSQIYRFQDGASLSNQYGGGALIASAFPEPAATWNNANGTPWTYIGASDANVRFGSPLIAMSESTTDSWARGATAGVWTADFGNGSFNFDLAPYYTAAADRNYITLTGSSLAQWNNIRANHLTGLFTFQLTQSISSLGFATAAAYSNLGSAFATISGDSFTINFTTATTSGAFSAAPYMYLRGERAALATLDINGNSVSYFEENVTVVGGAMPVPAPGAIALLGLAGLAGRRRR